MERKTSAQQREIAKLNGLVAFLKHNKLKTLKQAEEIEKKYYSGLISLSEYHALMSNALKGRTKEQLAGHYDTQILDSSDKITDLESEIDRESILLQRETPPYIFFTFVFICSIIILSGIFLSVQSNPTAFTVLETGNFTRANESSQNTNDLQAEAMSGSSIGPAGITAKIKEGIKERIFWAFG